MNMHAVFIQAGTTLLQKNHSEHFTVCYMQNSTKLLETCIGFKVCISCGWMTVMANDYVGYSSGSSGGVSSAIKDTTTLPPLPLHFQPSLSSFLACKLSHSADCWMVTGELIGVPYSIQESKSIWQMVV